MKKILIVAAAFALGAAAHAKSIAELRSEFDAEYRKGWAETVAFVNAEADGIKGAWDEYKAAPAAKKAEWDPDRRIFSIAYCAGLGLEGSDWVLCCLHAETWARAKAADNPAFYGELKAGGWSVEGNKMTQGQISAAAIAAKDFSYFETAPGEAFAGLYWGNGELFRFFAQNLLSMSDAAKAKEICNKIEAALILENKSGNAPALSQVQGLSKALTARLLDAKLSK